MLCKVHTDVKGVCDDNHMHITASKNYYIFANWACIQVPFDTKSEDAILANTGHIYPKTCAAVITEAQI